MQIELLPAYWERTNICDASPEWAEKGLGTLELLLLFPLLIIVLFHW